MANIALVLKNEIIRLARKEVRTETEGLKKAAGKYRSEIAALKRQVAAAEKQLARFAKKAPSKVSPDAAEEGTTRHRYSSKRFAAQRQKLGLSAGEMGILVGVSAQTIYNWEAGKSRPRPQQLAAIAAVRAMGKRSIKTRLEESCA